MNKNFFLILILFSINFVFSNFVFSQEMVPFVTNIKSYSFENQVLITWDIQTENNFDILVFREKSYISSIDNLKEIAILPKNTKKYSETIDEEGSYYYAVVFFDRKRNKKFNVIIPYKNSLTTPVIVKKKGKYEITKIDVKNISNYININWEYESDNTDDINVYIYRNNQPISSKEILDKSLFIGSTGIKSKNFKDTPNAGLKFYYACIINNINPEKLVEGKNYSGNGVFLSSKINFVLQNSSNYFKPLPLLSLQKDPVLNKYFEDKQILKYRLDKASDEKLDQIHNENLQRHSDIKELLKKRELEKEKLIDFEILKDEEIFTLSIKNEQYKDAIKKLSEKDFENAKKILEETICYINDNDNGEMERVAYYLAVSYYQTGEYYNSYIYFIVCKDKFFYEATKYINSLNYILFNQLEF